MAFMSGLINGYVQSLEQRRATKLQMELASKFFDSPAPQIIERKISCEYCGRKGSTDQCVSCGAPLANVSSGAGIDIAKLLVLQRMPGINISDETIASLAGINEH